MLRHRVIQQCARLAFGISTHENYISNTDKNAINLIKTIHRQKEKNSKSEALKELLAKRE
jgi:hypothetical protein